MYLNTVSQDMKELAIGIVRAYRDAFAPEGISRHILGYMFTIDTGTSPSTYCRPPNYGPNEGEIIMRHMKVLLGYHIQVFQIILIMNWQKNFCQRGLDQS